MTDSEQVSLAEAVELHIISCSVEAARKRAQRDPAHPLPAGRRGMTYMYDQAELHAYDGAHGKQAKEARLESWAAIPGFKGYEASSTGRVRSVDRTYGNGRSYRGVILARRKSNRGYWLVNLRDDTGKWQTRSVHKLVLLAHAGPPPPGQVSRHLNDDQEDNRWPENLAYGTPVDNEQDKFANGKPRAVPKPPRLCVRCGSAVDKGGKRCHACVVEVGQRAAKLLAAGVTLDDACQQLEYPHASGLHTLARKYGSYGVPSATKSPRVTTTLRHWLHRRKG